MVSLTPNDKTPPSEESGVKALRALLAWCAIVEAASIQDGYLLLTLDSFAAPPGSSDEAKRRHARRWLHYRSRVRRYVERWAYAAGMAFVALGAVEDERAVIYRRAR